MIKNPNFVKRVVYKVNMVVIYFDSPMMRYGYNGYLVPHNYALMELDPLTNNVISKYIPSSNNTGVKEIYISYTVKFTFFNNDFYLKKDILLSAGYINLKSVLYITSTDNRVNDFCTKTALGNEATDINISEGTANKLNNSTLLYSCNQNNSFSPDVYSSDFYVIAGTEKIYPIDVIYDYTSGCNITLIFSSNALSYTGQMTLFTIHSPKTKDVFDCPILGDKFLVFQDTDTIILPPGQVIPYSSSPIEKNFIIYISKNVPYRTYGYTNKVTITGWIKVYEVSNENLDVGQQLIFTNLKVNKSMEIHCKNGDIVLDSLDLNSLSIFRN